jgi:hypothetical protein
VAKVQRFSLSVGEQVNGNNIKILGYTFSGKRKGKSVYIQGGIHGGEVTFWILNKLFSILSKEDISGSVTLIPIANPLAWNTQIYFNTPGKFNLQNGKDWNRNFPGNKNGSFSERIAFELYSKAKDADFILDLHTSRDSVPFTIISRKEDIQYAKTLGIELNYFSDDLNNKTYEGCLTNQIELSQGKPAMTIECGGHDSYNKRNISCVFNGIRDLLTEFQIINKKYKTDKILDQLYFSRLINIRCTQSGFVNYIKKPGDIVEKGEPLYEVLNIQNIGSRFKQKSEIDGRIIKIIPTHIVNKGDVIVSVAPKASFLTL